MTERDEFKTSAADAALDKQLLALKHFAPLPGFDSRVMARVARRMPELAPVTPSVRIPARAGRTSRRLWWGTGLAAAGSTAWTAAAVSWVSSVGGLGPVNAWLGTHVSEPLRAAAFQAAAAAGKSLLAYGATAWDTYGTGLFAIAAASALTPVLSAWGLFLTMKKHSSKRMPAYAGR